MSSDVPDLSLQLEEDAKDPSHSSHGLNRISVNEFEEIERLIQENTVVDSNDESDFDGEVCESGATRQDTGYQTEIRDKSATEVQDESSGSQSALPLEQGDLNPPSPETPFEISSATDGFFQTGTNAAVEPDPEGWRESERDRLVATFGTTEKFEALLEQQLQDIEANDDRSEEDQPSQHNMEVQHVDTSESGDPTKPVKSRVEKRERLKASSRKTRSPAANRVKRAQRLGSGRHQPHSLLHHESSDDLSVRSDVSRTELRQRLKKESKGRKQDKDVVKQLQNDYDDLLTKYAEAENVIDQLRIGAKIDLFAQLPSTEHVGDLWQTHSSPEGLGSKSEEILPGNAGISSVVSRESIKAGENTDNLTENSLQLPSVASAEFIRVALSQQSKDLKERIEYFQALLQEEDLPEGEKKQALRNIEELLKNLERDYISAGHDYESDKRKAAYGFKRGVAVDEEFDPGNEIEAQICRIGRMVDKLKTNVFIADSALHTPVSYRRSARTPDTFYGLQTSSDSAEEDIDHNFRDLLQRYNKNMRSDNEADHTTAPSIVLSTDEDSDTSCLQMLSDTSANMEVSPARQRSFRSTLSRPIISTDASPQAGELAGARDVNEVSPVSQSHQQRRQVRSRLPRPVSRGRVETNQVKNGVGKQEFQLDSGFASAAATAGSESSRQSASTVTTIQPPTTSQGFLRKPGSVTTSVRHQIVPQHKKLIRQTEKAKVPVTSKPESHPGYSQAHTTPLKTAQPLHENRSRLDSNSISVPLQSEVSENSDEDVSTSSTVQALGSRMKFVAAGSSGSPLMATKHHHIERGKYRMPTGAGSDFSKSSSRRSRDSGSADSMLDMLRGEIAKLRAEIRETRDQEQLQKDTVEGTHAKTSIQPTVAEDGHDTKVLRQKSTSHSKSPKDIPASPQRPLRRSGSLDRSHPTEGKTPAPQPATGPSTMPAQRHGMYVLPPASRYPCLSVSAVNQPAAVFASPPATFVPTGSVFLNLSVSPARIYFVASPPVTVLQTAISHARGTVIRRPTRKARGFCDAPLYVFGDSSDEEDIPLSRSQLSPFCRRSSVPRIHRYTLDHGLSASLNRAEKMSDTLRSKSNGMHRSLRNSLHKAEVLASTM